MNTRTHTGRAPLHSGGRASGLTILEMLISLTLAVVLLTSIAMLYNDAARGAAKNASRAVAERESKFITERLARQFRLVGLVAFEDAAGDSNDISRDVPGYSWSDSLRQNFEYANTYDIVFTGDVDNDSCTETVRYLWNLTSHTVEEVAWRWDRDSTRWIGPVVRDIGSQVDYLMFRYFDKDGNTIPNPQQWPTGGYTLSSGERARVTAVELTVVTRSGEEENGRSVYLAMPDGQYWYDRYRRVVHRFMVRGRNLSLGT